MMRVVMTGSRTDPAAAHDRFQDYDITYLVEEVTPYRQNRQVPLYFGDIMVLQTPDDMGNRPAPRPAMRTSCSSQTGIGST